MVRKIGGSRGNPPMRRPCVSCHWRSARHVPAKDCTVWLHERHRSRSLSLSLPLPLFLSLFFSLSESSCLPHVMQRLACSNGIPIPPVFKKWGQNEIENKDREGRRQLLEHKTYKYIQPPLTNLLWLFLWRPIKCHYHSDHISLSLCLHPVTLSLPGLPSLTHILLCHRCRLVSVDWSEPFCNSSKESVCVFI